VDSEGLGLGKFCGARVWENSVDSWDREMTIAPTDQEMRDQGTRELLGQSVLGDQGTARPKPPLGDQGTARPKPVGV
jgi:hypothetical protein